MNLICRQKRIRILTSACEFGEPKCLAEAGDRLKQFIIDENQMPDSDLRVLVFKYGKLIFVCERSPIFPAVRIKLSRLEEATRVAFNRRFDFGFPSVGLTLLKRVRFVSRDVT